MEQSTKEKTTFLNRNKRWLKPRFSILTLILGIMLVSSLSIMSIIAQSQQSLGTSIIQDIQTPKNALYKEKILSFFIPTLQLPPLIQHTTQRKITIKRHRLKFISFCREIFKTNTLVKRIHFSDLKGNYVSIKKEENQGYISTYLNKIAETPFIFKQTFDKNKVELNRSVLTELPYNPTEMSWFKQALETNTIAWSTVNPFESDANANLILSKPSINTITNEVNGVLAIEIELASFINYLKSDMFDQSTPFYLINKEKDIAFHTQSNNEHMATPSTSQSYTLNTISSPLFTKALGTFLNKNKKESSFIYKGEHYNATSASLTPILDKNWQLITIHNINNYILPLTKNHRSLLMRVSIIILITILLFWGILHRLTLNLRKLKQETLFLSQLNLNERPLNTPSFKDVQPITTAIKTIKKTLRIYNQYLPKHISLEALKNNQKLNWIKEEQLTVLTTYSPEITQLIGQSDNEILLENLSLYFNTIAEIIKIHNGTLLSINGNQITAFWHTPKDKDLITVSKAAIELQSHLHRLYHTWQKDDKPCFKTQLSLHTENGLRSQLTIGDRLEYLLLGSPSNTSIEQHHKASVLGHTIVVSNAVHKQISHYFICRQICLDKNTPLYELLGEQQHPHASLLNEIKIKFEKALTYVKEKNYPQAQELLSKLKEIDTNPDLINTHLIHLTNNTNQTSNNMSNHVFSITKKEKPSKFNA